MRVLKEIEIEGGWVRVLGGGGQTVIQFSTPDTYGALTEPGLARDLADALTEAADAIEGALAMCIDPEGDAWMAEQARLAQARIDAIARVEAIKDEPFDAREVRLAMMQLAAATGNLIAPGRLAS